MTSKEIEQTQANDLTPNSWLRLIAIELYRQSEQKIISPPVAPTIRVKRKYVKRDKSKWPS